MGEAWPLVLQLAILTLGVHEQSFETWSDHLLQNGQGLDGVESSCHPEGGSSSGHGHGSLLPQLGSPRRCAAARDRLLNRLDLPGCCCL